MALVYMPKTFIILSMPQFLLIIKLISVQKKVLAISSWLFFLPLSKIFESNLSYVLTSMQFTKNQLFQLYVF